METTSSTSQRKCSLHYLVVQGSDSYQKSENKDLEPDILFKVVCLRLISFHLCYYMG